MTVLPFGRSGVVAASMLGLGRALGETVAVLIILRSAAKAGELVAVRRRLHLRLQDRLSGSRIQRAAAYRGLHLGRLRAVRPDVCGQRGRPRDRRWEGQRMSSDCAGPAGQRSDDSIPSAPFGRSRTTLRRQFFLVSFGIALVIPLVWVLWIVIERGWYAVTRSGWWTHSLQGVLPEQFAGGIYHALYGTLVQAGVAAIYWPCRWG